MNNFVNNDLRLFVVRLEVIYSKLVFSMITCYLLSHNSLFSVVSVLFKL